MNITEAQVSQVERNDDGTYTVPALLVCRRYRDLSMTLLYDLLTFGVPWDELTDLLPNLNVPPNCDADAVMGHCVRRGRVVVDEWHGPVTHRSHIEPV